MLLLPVRPAGVCDAASAVGAVGGTKSCVCGSVWRCVKAIWPHLLLGRAFVLPMRCCCTATFFRSLATFGAAPVPASAACPFFTPQSH